VNWRALTPLGWAISAVAVIVAVALLAAGWNRLWSWLPWSAESRADRSEAVAGTAKSDAGARGLEVAGEQRQAQRVDTYHREVITIQAATSEAVAAARSAPDASEPLPADRAERLRRLDVQLCDVRPAICPPAPAGDPG
jgi:hypothetical protein